MVDWVSVVERITAGELSGLMCCHGCSTTEKYLMVIVFYIIVIRQPVYVQTTYSLGLRASTPMTCGIKGAVDPVQEHKAGEVRIIRVLRSPMPSEMQLLAHQRAV